MNNRQIISHKGIWPKIADNAFIADGVRIAGTVDIAEDCGIWFNTVIRGDVSPIVIKKGTSIQDNSTVHVGNGEPCIVGENVTVGHNVLLHGCRVGDNCLIGMGSILLNGAEIGDYSIVGAGAIVTQKKIFPPRSMIVGSPAKIVREVTDEEIERIIMRSGESYRKKAVDYLAEQQEYNKQNPS